MGTYFDFLPIEVLVLCIPEDDIYNFFSIKSMYKNYKALEVLDKFVLIRHPYYFKIMNREVKELSHSQILKKLFWYMRNYLVQEMRSIKRYYYDDNEDNYIEKLREDLLFKVLYPFILKYKYMKGLEILVDDIDVKIYGGKFFFDLTLKLADIENDIIPLIKEESNRDLLIKILNNLNLEKFYYDNQYDNIEDKEIEKILIKGGVKDSS